MRVFLSCQQALQSHAVAAYSFWETYFKSGLAEGGHTWIENSQVDWAEGLAAKSSADTNAWLDRTWGGTTDFIRREHKHRPIDLFLSYLFPQQIDPGAITQIQKLGIPCVNFFCDNVREFTQVPRSFFPFDLHWVPEAEARAFYQKAGLSFVFAPMPVWIPPEQRHLPDHEKSEATFIGSHDVLREALLAEAVSRGLPLRLQGTGWNGAAGNRGPLAAPTQTRLGKLGNQLQFLREHGLRGFVMKLSYKMHRPPPRTWLVNTLHSAVSDGEYFRLTRESAVTLGINRYPSFRRPFNRPHTYSRLRDIEAPMLGACYLTEAAPGLEDLYELGQEIEIYHTAEELAAKASELLADPQRRRTMRARAQRRALAEHTIPRSIDKITAALGLA